MLVCIKCGYHVRGNFQHVRRSCYNILLGKLLLTREDFVDYLNLSFNQQIHYPPSWCFRNICEWLQYHIPSIKPLVNILESIMYLKLVLAKQQTTTRKLRLRKLFFNF